MGRVTPLRVLMEWRRYVGIVYEAVKAVEPSAEVYVAGGAAEGRITARSDIDVLVVLPRAPAFEEAVDLRVKILERAEGMGLPLHAPVELHIIGRRELGKYLGRGRVIPAGRL